MSALHKVLVVDDDPVVGRSFDRVLTGKGYVVITAENAQQALEQLRREDVDLVFTDIRMPGMDGVALAEQVKARRPWTPVVIVTGYGSTDNERRARAAGVSDFLHKPLTPEMIEGCASKALAPAATATAPTVTPAAAEPLPRHGGLKDVALFFAAPFIGLAYAVLLPFVGMGLLLWTGAQALRRAEPGTPLATLRHVLTGLATPFVGLAFVIAVPLAGPVALAWIGAKSLWSQRRAH